MRDPQLECDNHGKLDYDEVEPDGEDRACCPDCLKENREARLAEKEAIEAHE